MEGFVVLAEWIASVKGSDGKRRLHSLLVVSLRHFHPRLRPWLLSKHFDLCGTVPSIRMNPRLGVRRIRGKFHSYILNVRVLLNPTTLPFTPLVNFPSPSRSFLPSLSVPFPMYLASPSLFVFAFTYRYIYIYVYPIL